MTERDTEGKGPIKAVFFDIGETLISEEEIYGRWADWFGVPRHSFLALLGAYLATGRTHLHLLRHFRPDLDLRVEEKKMIEAGVPLGFGAADLYPDVRACL
ncbi:haloacid dehalogenase, partial [Actinomadura adrarensis]